MSGVGTLCAIADYQAALLRSMVMSLLHLSFLWLSCPRIAILNQRLRQYMSSFKPSLYHCLASLNRSTLHFLKSWLVCLVSSNGVLHLSFRLSGQQRSVQKHYKTYSQFVQRWWARYRNWHAVWRETKLSWENSKWGDQRWLKKMSTSVECAFYVFLRYTNLYSSEE